MVFVRSVMNHGRNVVIVGGSGFIGTHLSRELLSNGYNVTVIDLIPPVNNDVKFYKCDAADTKQICDILRDIGEVYGVYYLAAMIRSTECEQKPVEASHVNIQGLVSVLTACTKNNVRRILFSSTVHVYTGVIENKKIMTEDVNLTSDIMHIYAVTKYIGECLVRSFYETYKLNYTILRYGITYGPGGHEDGLIKSVINNIRKGRDVLIEGSGENKRSFLYVDDNVHANRLALESDDAENNIINISGPENLSVTDIVDTIIDTIQLPANKIHTPGRPGDFSGGEICRQRCVDIFHWLPDVKLKQGVSSILSY